MQALVYKGVPVVLHFQRQADAQWQPFELHLARCTRWTAGVQFALWTGRATERGRVGGGPGAREREGYPRPQGGRRGGGGGTPRSQQAEEQAEDFANAGDPWADAQ